MAATNMCTSCAKAVDAGSLIALFRGCFYEGYATELCGGADEPLYTPATRTQPARIHFRHDYPASALHEVAHWCIAGPERRKRVDYGYWYSPDGRSDADQQRFQAVEARPQALEWMFAQACQVPFRLSLDNLDGAVSTAARDDFAAAVCEAALRFQARGLTPRAASFFAALARFSRRSIAPTDLRFSRDRLL